MEIEFSLSLPRDEVSIPIARRICARSLAVLGVSRECIDDVEIALTEACSNVLLHARDDDQYEVSLGIDGGIAVIEVIDRGGGFDTTTADAGAVDAGTIDVGAVDAGAIDAASEHGRGILLMRALMDLVQFHIMGGPRPGTRVHLEKRLAWDDHAPDRRPGVEAVHAPWTEEHPLLDTASVGPC